MAIGRDSVHLCPVTADTFVERLRRRIESDPELTPAGLAIRAGLDNSAIRSLLVGRAKNPRWDTVEAICTALGTTVVEFMSDPQTEEEARILRLLGRLTVEEQLRLLGYGDRLLEERDRAPGPAPQADLQAPDPSSDSPPGGEH